MLSTEEEIVVDRLPSVSDDRPDTTMTSLASDDESSVLLPPPEDSNPEADDADPEADDADPEQYVDVNVNVGAEAGIQVETKTNCSDSGFQQQPLTPPVYKNSDKAPQESEPLSPDDRENEQEEGRLTLSPLSLALATADVLPSGDADSITTKTKIHERLIQALSKHEFSGQRRSPDLVPLTRNYQLYRKQLRSLIAAIKAYKKAMEQAELARSKLYQEYDDMSRNTPLSDYVTTTLDPQELAIIEMSAGLSAHEEAEPSNGLKLPFDELLTLNYEVNPSSLTSIQQIGKLLAMKTSLEHQKYILDFASEWHDAITTMLDREIDLVRQLQRRRIHYERKVGALRKRTNNIETKGKHVPASIAEKLLRNEQKLATAWENHEQRAARLCVLLEEVTENGWKDLFPLVQNSMTLEVNRVARDMASFGKMKLIVEKMTTSEPNSSPAILTYEV